MMRIIESTENKRDLEDDFVELHSEDSDTEQDISSEESEDELDMNEEYFLERVKDGGKIQLRRQIRKQPQNILCQFPLVQPNAKNAKIELET